MSNLRSYWFELPRSFNCSVGKGTSTLNDKAELFHEFPKVQSRVILPNLAIKLIFYYPIKKVRISIFMVRNKV